MLLFIGVSINFLTTLVGRMALMIRCSPLFSETLRYGENVFLRMEEIQWNGCCWQILHFWWGGHCLLLQIHVHGQTDSFLHMWSPVLDVLLGSRGGRQLGWEVWAMVPGSFWVLLPPLTSVRVGFLDLGVTLTLLAPGARWWFLVVKDD